MRVLIGKVDERGVLAEIDVDGSVSVDDPPSQRVDVFLFDDDGQDTRLEDGLFVEVDRDGTVEGMPE